MTTPPDPWTRPHHQPGGGDAFLFYVVHGSMPQKLEIAGSRYRCSGLPAGVDFMRYGRNAPSEVVGSFLKGFLWEHLQAENPSLAERIAAQPECAVIRGTVPDPADLGYFRDVVGLLTCLLDQGGVAVFDPQMFTWWEPERWRSEVFEPGTPSPARHVAVLASEEAGGTQWVHTGGMRKFGRPDLSIHGVAPEHHVAVLELCSRFVHLQALGGVIPDGQEIRVAPLPPGMICHRRGSLDDPDFNNMHVEITWPHLPGGA